MSGVVSQHRRQSRSSQKEKEATSRTRPAGSEADSLHFDYTDVLNGA